MKNNNNYKPPSLDERYAFNSHVQTFGFGMLAGSLFAEISDHGAVLSLVFVLLPTYYMMRYRLIWLNEKLKGK